MEPEIKFTGMQGPYDHLMGGLHATHTFDFSYAQARQWQSGVISEVIEDLNLKRYQFEMYIEQLGSVGAGEDDPRVLYFQQAMGEILEVVPALQAILSSKKDSSGNLPLNES